MQAFMLYSKRHRETWEKACLFKKFPITHNPQPKGSLNNNGCYEPTEFIVNSWGSTVRRNKRGSP